MKLIDISTPKFPDTFCMVDDDDFDRLFAFSWHPESYRGVLYVRGRMVGRKLKFIHRVIMDAPDGYLVDHVDHNPLNNQKQNLRLCSK